MVNETIIENLYTYEIHDPQGNLLTTVQGNDPRSVLGMMMLVWGEDIEVKQVPIRGPLKAAKRKNQDAETAGKFPVTIQVETLWAIRDIANEIVTFVKLGAKDHAIDQAERIQRIINEAIVPRGTK